MAQKIYITTVCGGMCATKSDAGIFSERATDSAQQHWITEVKDEEPQTLAFRNVGSDEYLRADNGNAYGTITTGQKQWWTLERGLAPGSYWLKCSEYENTYLCNANGNHTHKNKMYCWPKQDNWTFALTWYLKDANSNRSWLPDFTATPSTSEVNQLLATVNDKEAANAKREQAIADDEMRRRSDLDHLQAKLEEREQAIAAREAKAEKSAAADSSVRDQDVPASTIDSPNNALARRMAELDGREQESAVREAEISRREALHVKAVEANRNDDGDIEGSNKAKVSEEKIALVAENKRLEKEMEAMKKKAAMIERGRPAISGLLSPGVPLLSTPATSLSFAMGNGKKLRAPQLIKPKRMMPARNLMPLNPTFMERGEKSHEKTLSGCSPPDDDE